MTCKRTPEGLLFTHGPEEYPLNVLWAEPELNVPLVAQAFENSYRLDLQAQGREDWRTCEVIGYEWLVEKAHADMLKEEQIATEVDSA